MLEAAALQAFGQGAWFHATLFLEPFLPQAVPCKIESIVRGTITNLALGFERVTEIVTPTPCCR